MSIRPTDVPIEQALDAYTKGDRRRAGQLCAHILRAEPGHVGASFLLGAIAFDEKQLPTALAQVERVLQVEPRHARALQLRGEIYRSAQQSTEALASFKAAIEADPSLAQSYVSMGLLLIDAGELAAARQAFEAGLQANPGHPRLHLNLGRVLQVLLEPERAIACYREAIRLKPDYAVAYNNLGVALIAQGQAADALPPLRRALEIRPLYVEAHVNSGIALQTLKQPEAALASFKAALRLQPEHFKARFKQAIALETLNDLETSFRIFGRLVEIQPENGEVWQWFARLLMMSNQWERAHPALEQAVKHAPDAVDSEINLLYVKQMLCDWRDRAPAMTDALARTESRINDGLPSAIIPFHSIVFGWPPEALLAIAQAASRPVAASMRELRDTLAAQRQARKPGRLRIGYFSGDFNNHAVSHLAQGLFGLHDREKFEVFAYSWGIDDGSDYRRRIERDCEHFVDLRALQIDATARRIAADDIDLLVDLTGYTGRTRIEVMAARPARVQIGWLGFPGTTGADFIDYLIGDAVVTPPESAALFSEKILRLPHSYLITDHQQPIADTNAGRLAEGLPEHGFVFASFNNAYKFEPVIWDCWMRILHAVPESVLWLKAGSDTMQANLLQAAAARGILSERLVFCTGFPPKDEHLSRMRLADLFLDTLHYNAHTTAIDALWAGLPVLTCPGQSFASRAGASLLSAIGLPSLIARDLADYEALAIQLAQHPAALSALRETLQQNIRRSPLFDTPRFVRTLERCFQAVWAIHADGEAPRSLDIPA